MPFWVGGTGNWNDTAHWSASSGGPSGAAVPTVSDDVVFDASSGAGIATVNVAAVCRSFTTTGYTGTITGSQTLTVAGSWTMGTALTWSYNGDITLTNTLGAAVTITNSGKRLTTGNVTFNGAAGGSFTLNDAIASGTGNLTFTRGTFNSNGFNISTTGFVTVGVNFTALNISGSTAWTVSTNWTFGSTPAVASFSSTSSLVINGSFSGGGATYGLVTLNSSTGSSSLGISGANTFAGLTLPTAGISYLLLANQVVGNLTITGTATDPIGFYSGTFGTQRTLTVNGTVSISFVDFQDIIVNGASAPITGTAIADGTNNSGITFTYTPTTRYWVGNGGAWNATTHWAATSNGAGGQNPPRLVDTAVFNASSFSLSSQTVTMPLLTRLGTINTTGILSSATVTVNGALIYGSIIQGTTANILISGSTLTMVGQAAVTVSGVTNPFQLNGAGQSLVINKGPTGSVTLGSAASFSAASWNLTSGTLDTANFNLTTTIFIATGGTLNLGSSILTAGNNTGSTGVLTITAGATIIPGTSTIAIAANGTNARTVALGSKTYNKVKLSPTAGSSSAAQTITGSNTIDTLELATLGFFKFTTGTTQTINTLLLSAAGADATHKYNIRSTTAAAHFFSKATGYIDADWLDLANSSAVGGANFYAGANSTNSGSNFGWLFSAYEAGDISSVSFIPVIIQSFTLELGPLPGYVQNSLIPNITQSLTLGVEGRVAEASNIPPLDQVSTVEVEVHFVKDETIPALAQVFTGKVEASFSVDQQIPAPVSFIRYGLEALFVSGHSIPAVVNNVQIAVEAGYISASFIPIVATALSLESVAEMSADQQILDVVNVVSLGLPLTVQADQQVPPVSSALSLARSWTPIIPYGFGAQLLYKNSSSLERAMADVEVDHLMSINAELIIENWDPYQVQSRNIPYLAFGLGVSLWEDDYWSDATKRGWLADQWTFKSLRGTIAGVRMALEVSRYTLTEYVTPPQGFYLSPDLTPEEWNTWVRRMPELRFTYAPKTGKGYIDEAFFDDGFLDATYVSINDGFALRGRYAVLRHLGVDTPLDIIDYQPGFADKDAVEYERVATAGKSELGFFIEESAFDENQFLDEAEIDPTLYTLRIDTQYQVDISQIHLSTLQPTLEPFTPAFEVNSDIGKAGPFFFLGDSFVDDGYIDNPDGADKLLAQRMYLLDPAVAAPMMLGISFLDADLLGMPTFTEELMIDLHTKERNDATFTEDAFFDDQAFYVAENPEHIERALRAVIEGKALRDTALVTFDPLRPVALGDYLTEATLATDWVPNHL